MNNNELVFELAGIVGEANVLENVAMKEYTSFKAGGPADLLISPQNFRQLSDVLKKLAEKKSPFYLMGEATNILVKDEGYKGAIVKIGKSMSQIKVDGERIIAESGALIKNVSKIAQEQGLSGLEFAVGIPGSVGGTTFMNAGAYDGDMGKVVESVEVIKNDGSKSYTLYVHDLEFGYRKSRIMEKGEIVLKTTFKLKSGNPEEIKAKMQEFQQKRSQKQPLQYPSGGSFFKRPPGNYAGTLIDKCGLKGRAVGGAMVSPLHAGFIVNTGKATATDIITLMEIVKEEVYEMSGVKLEPEIRIIGGDNK